MIFVTVGSTDFDALVSKMDELAYSLDVDIVAQIGLGSYVPLHMDYFRFEPSLERYYERADLVVGHGGLGTIVEALSWGKKLVCVVNPAVYDRHQEDLLHVFEQRSNLVWCKDIENLGQAIQEAQQRDLAPYQPEPCRIHEIIAEYLRE